VFWGFEELEKGVWECFSRKIVRSTTTSRSNRERATADDELARQTVGMERKIKEEK
jgi:hypothetical protein